MPSIIELRRKPNPDLVATLKDLLARAEAGELSALAVTTVDRDGHGHFTYTDCLTLIGAVHCMLADMTRDG